MAKKKEPVKTFNYCFKSWTVKKAFKQYAVENDTSVQELITTALKAKYKEVEQ